MTPAPQQHGQQRAFELVSIQQGEGPELTLDLPNSRRPGKVAETLQKLGQSLSLTQHLDKRIWLEEAGNHLTTLSKHSKQFGKGLLVDDELAGTGQWRYSIVLQTFILLHDQTPDFVREQAIP